MSLVPGTKLGPYEIVAPLGAGGMGEVWRARDPRLGRDVAIKALPAGFARDPERVARFEREAKLLASLSHPNIAGIFGLEEAGGARYLVLEYVEGETLAERLAHGPLAAAEALEIARQIAAGVEAAHDSGVVHRDLKPGNVMLKPDGTVKVLDFGLAKSGVASSTGSDPNLSASPTMTYAATQQGVILGTAAYMSPEQARGRGVDRRTDIWSFGCVLFECLAGRKAYEGETVSDLVARILEREPDWAALPGTTPDWVRSLIARCLAKDPKQRLQAIGEARIAIERGDTAAPAGVPAAAPAPRSGLRAALVIAAVAAAGLALGSLLPRLRPVAPERATRLSLISPDTEAAIGELGSYALSPDGRILVFARADSQGTGRLFVRPLDQDQPRMLEGTEGAQWPFWSPDSRDIAFFSGGRLRRVPATGGAVRTVCEASNGRGGSWGSAGTIVFAPDPRGGLAAVEAAGGVPKTVTTIDSANGETSHRFPSFLPDGRHFLFVVNEATQGTDAPVKLGSLDDPRTRELLRSRSAAVFAAPEHVLFTRDRALLAQRIDPRSLEPVGEPRLLEDQPEVTGGIQLSPATSCSRTGVMVYTPPDRRPTAVTWLGRDARPAATGLRFPASVAVGALAPDRRRLVVMEAGPEGYANWLGDLGDGTVSQIAPPGKGVFGPLWNPAGTRIVGTTQAGLRLLDPAGGADSTIDSGDNMWRRPSCWTPDGRTLVLSGLVEGNRYDLQTLTLEPGETPRPFVSTTADESEASLSHDGRWIAYQSDASGRREVYVQRFPERSEAVRSGVGSPFGAGSLNRVAWRADDRELYFIGGDGLTLYAVEVVTAPRLAMGTPRPLLRVPQEARDVILTDDGRVLALLPVGSRPRSITVVHGWMGETAAAR